MKSKEEIDQYLASIRKTIADSRAAVESVRLRMAETDRMLESQGYTREQVMNFRISRDQKQFVNEELRRRGLPPVEEDEAAFDFNAATDELRRSEMPPEPSQDGSLADRQRKFGNFMQEFRI